MRQRGVDEEVSAEEGVNEQVSVGEATGHREARSHRTYNYNVSDHVAPLSRSDWS